MSSFAPRKNVLSRSERRQSQSRGTDAAPLGSSRLGTTLSEVLISLLVMSIGVVSLATLFPIAVLRSVQATHLTNAANLRYNVEALLSVRPQLFSIGTPWVAGSTYAVGDLVTPTELTSLKSPPVVFQCTTAGNAGTQEPNWNFTNGQPTVDGGVTWLAFRLQNYVIDPLGKWNVESSFRSTAANGDFFGNNGTSPRAIQLPSGAWNVRAFPGVGANNQYVAADVATLPDSWMMQAEGTLLSPTATTVTYKSCIVTDLQDDLSLTVPVDSTGTGQFAMSRIVFFDITGKFSHVRPITSITGSPPSQTITWPNEDTNGNSVFDAGEDLNGNGMFDYFGPLPVGFIPGRARIETREQRYTWLLSVRRGFSGTSFMDVVVFFRRPFSAKDEQAYSATFTQTMDPGFDGKPGISGVDDDGKNGADDLGELGWPGSDDAPRNWVVVQYDDSTGDKPHFKKGGFVTDADNLRWYRIIDIVEGNSISGYTPDVVMKRSGLKTTTSSPAGILVADAPAFGANTRSVLLRVENQILQSGPQPAAPGGTPTGAAMLMRGVVDVYPIRTHLTWEN